MNITTPYPSINLNTSNVYTETARRDNQLREVIPQPTPVVASSSENKSAGDGEKAKASGQQQSGVYDARGQVENEDPRGIEERTENESNEQEASEDNSERGEGRQDSEKENAQAEEEAKQIKELKARDTEVRIHEQAHASVGGSYAGSPSFEYQRGPDGRNYAVGGEVMIDVSEVPGDPKATIAKMTQVRAAALAPAEPSGADRSIAADATQKLAAAQTELAASALKSEDESEPKRAQGINTAPKKRLVGDDAALNTEQRAPEVDARAMRIAQFYSAATSPNRSPGFAAQI